MKERRNEVGVVTSGVTTGRTTVVTTDVMAAGTYMQLLAQEPVAFGLHV